MKAYQLKIQIKDSHPPIWRRVIVPAGLSFSQLSIVLNKVMGWCGYHLSSFEFYHLGIKIEEDAYEFEDIGYGDYELMDSSETMIDPYLDSEDWFTYTYDFGDNWDHRVTVEKIITDYDKNYSQVIKFKGGTPYEDCGGIYGYYRVLEILRNPEDPEYEEMKAWTDGHFTRDYDPREVNTELEALYLSEEKSAPMTQNQIYDEILEKGAPFKQIQGIKEICSPECDDLWEEDFEEEYDEDDYKEVYPEEDIEAAMKKFSKLLKRYDKEFGINEERQQEKDEWNEWLEDKSENGTLKDILRCYSKQEMVEIAKIHGLKGFSKYNKDRLLDFLYNEMLDADVLRRYFKFLNDAELKLLEQAVSNIEIEYSDDRYDYLLYGGYAGYSAHGFGGSVIVTRDVCEVYRQYCDEDWKEQRKKDIRLLHHINAAAELNGVCTLDDAFEIYEHNTNIHLDEFQRLSFCLDVPENRKRFTVMDNLLILKGLEDPDQVQSLLKVQEGKKLYLPTQKEAESLGEYGYVPFDKYMNLLARFFINQGQEEKEDAESMCKMIQFIMRRGGNFQDVMDYLDGELLGYDFIVEDDRAMDSLTKKLQDVWNHTRQVIHRGYQPVELGSQPVRSQAEGDNVIPFPQAPKKKVYPNDPCPCGSGKKYKYCCGKK